MNNRGYTINHRKDSLKETQARKLKVPAANIIDLKKIQKEKNQVEKAKKDKSVWEKMDKIQWPTIKIPSLIFKRRRKIKEKVIVSQARDFSRKKRRKPTAAPMPEEKIDYSQFQLTTGWYKRLLGFTVVCLLIILPVYLVSFYQKASEAKGQVLGISSEAYQFLQEAGNLASASEFDLASQNFSQASENFLLAKQQLEEAGGFILTVTKLMPGKAKSAQYLLEAGNSLSQVGIVLTDLISGLMDLDINPFEGQESSLTEFLVFMRDNLLPVQEKLDTAVKSLEQVRVEDLPKEYQPGITRVKEMLPVLRDNFQDFFLATDALLKVFGHESPKRYLFIFQNNRELRPTGGFLGSIALVDMYKGKVENLEVPGGGIYDVAGQLKEKIIAPKPLWLVSPHWNIQDANWFVDFPTSAKKLIWFFERTGGATVDGIIALTPKIIEDLFEVIGPIDMQDQYGVVVDHNNFVRQAQYWAEVEYDREENKPKKFIGDLLPILLNRVFQVEPDKLLKVVGVFNNALTDRDLLFYFSDSSLEQKIKDLAWDGSVKSTDKDYLLVVDTNIAGGKTNHVIEQMIEHQAEIQSDGSIIDTVTVRRAHRGNALDLWEGVANVSYLRFYVPAGSKLISVSGFTDIPSFRYQLPDEGAVPDEDLLAIENGSIIDERSNTRITKEFGKAVFGNWISVDPGEVKQVQIQYKLPFKLEVGGLLSKTDTYSLLVQKQPGLVNSYFVSNVVIPAGYEVLWSYPDLRLVDNRLQYITDLNSDKYFGILLKK